VGTVSDEAIFEAKAQIAAGGFGCELMDRLSLLADELA
jgi:hypothetical protein